MVCIKQMNLAQKFKISFQYLNQNCTETFFVLLLLLNLIFE